MANFNKYINCSIMTAFDENIDENNENMENIFLVNENIAPPRVFPTKIACMYSSRKKKVFFIQKRSVFHMSFT